MIGIITLLISCIVAILALCPMLILGTTVLVKLMQVTRVCLSKEESSNEK